MANRSATDTIKGYFYQFDLSILKLLTLSGENDSVQIECIEDIDVHTASDSTVIQCKYYEHTEYNHSVIKDAVQNMLIHFSKVKEGQEQPVNYLIYGYYQSGCDKLKDPIDLEYLKKHFLTRTKNKIEHRHHEKLNLNDDDLKAFLAVLTIDIRASEFQQQLQEVNDKLTSTFSCKSTEADFYYNNALSVIKKLATDRDPAKRTITKKDFLTQINTKTVLFNEWFIQKKGKSAYLKAIRAMYFTHMNVSPFERFFLVEVNPASYTRSTLKDLVHEISRKYSKLSKLEKDSYCPYLFIHGINGDELMKLKSDLWREGFWLFDGYDFQGAEFNPSSIARQATHHNQIKIKILNSLPDLKLTINSISTKTREIYQFHLGADGYCDFTHPSVKHVKIQVEQLSDIKEII